MDVKTIFTLDVPLSQEDEELHCPAMPTTTDWKQGHRTKNEHSGWTTFNAAVARPVKRAEFESNPMAKKAMDAEVLKLQTRGVWLIDKVEEWSRVRARTQQDPDKQVHIGNDFGICVEKGSELPEGTVGQEFKGRYVSQGNRVYDEYSEAALYNELGSSPASMEAAKAVDAHGFLKEHVILASDADQAYTQALLGDEVPGRGTIDCKVKTEGWVRLPPEARPKSWANLSLRDPVVPHYEGSVRTPRCRRVQGGSLREALARSRV